MKVPAVNKWLTVTSAAFLLLTIISLIETYFFRAEDYFTPKSLITLARRAEACGSIIPRPTLTLIEENKTRVCALFMDGGNHKNLSSEIKDFDKLEILTLAANRLTALPKELSLLPLKYLDLGKNQFITIPRPVFELKELEKLEMGFNRIRSVPRDISKLSELKFLSFNNNKLIRLPKEIGELKKLEFLELGNNNIVILPKEIGKLTSLKELYLYNNKLEEIPKEIGLLNNLEILDLRDNRLEKVPDEIRRLKKLQRIEF